MLRTSFINILGYLLLKYIVVYAVFMIATNNFKLLGIDNIKNGNDLFYYLWIVLFIPIMNMIFFSFPYFLSFKIKKRGYFFLSIGLIVLLEYLGYVYFTSQKSIDVKGIYISLISLCILYFLFFRRINSYIINNKATQ